MTDFVKRLVKILNDEWDRFGRQTYSVSGALTKKGRQEWEDGFWQDVEVYWKSCDLPYTGKDRHKPWSAVLISHGFINAGSGLIKTASHYEYLQYAASDNPYFKVHRVGEYKPKVGDIIVYARQEGVDFDNFKDLGWFMSHGEVFVSVTKNRASTISGNVGHSVAKQSTRLKDGFVYQPPRPYFVIIENLL